MAKKSLIEFFQGKDGGNSSKRLVGIPCAIIGVGMHLYLFNKGLSQEIPAYSDLSGTANDLLLLAGALLGIGVFEKGK